MTLHALLAGQPVVPVLRIEHARDAVPLARALAAGGLPAIEITLRTPAALDAIRAVADEVADAIVGAGTVLDPAGFEAAARAGARFLVSPGATRGLLDIAADVDLPYLPGATTPSEIMAMRDAGYETIKFFPAEQSGGAALLKALASPLAGMRFCPTGGVSQSNAAAYLALPNVLCVGGSWVAPDEAVRNADWAAITALATRAAALRRS